MKTWRIVSGALISSLFFLNANAGSLYLGVVGGRDLTLDKLDTTLPAAPASNRNTTSMLDGWFWGGQAGYKWYLGRGILGVNTIDGWSTASSKREVTRQYTLKEKWSYSFNAEGGFRLGNIDYEALLGLAVGEFKRNGDTAVAPGQNFSASKPGLQVGAKISGRICKYLELSGIYLYDYYQHINASGTTGFGTENAKNQFSEQRYLVALSYITGMPIQQSNVFGTGNHNTYFGADFGYDFTRMVQSVSTNTVENYGLNGVIGGPYFGYNAYSSFQNHLNIALEAFANFSDSKMKEERPSNPAAEFQFSYDYALGVTLNPGIYISKDFLVYAKLGQVYGKFTGTGRLRESTNTTFHELVPGLLVGAGVSSAISKNARLRLEYDFGYYQDIKRFDTSNNERVFKPRTNDFLLGISYYV